MRLRSVAFLAALCIFLLGGAAHAETQLKLEYSPLAPEGEVQALQQRAADAWSTQLYMAFPEGLRARVGMISTEAAPHGVIFRFELQGSPDDQQQAARFAQATLQQLTDQASLSFALRLTLDGQEAPTVPFPTIPSGTASLGQPVKAASHAPAGLAGLGLLSLILLGLIEAGVLWRRRQVLALPMRHGLPILAILPAGLGLGGRFLELQSPPAQALGIFFRRLAATSGRHFREAVVAGSQRDASAVVAACLAIALLREHGRVLVVDLAGDESPLPEILEETNDAGELPMEGTLRATAIADLDLLTGLLPSQDQRPPLPPTLVGQYRWVIYLAPPGVLLEASRHVWVMAGEDDRRDVRRARWAAFWRSSTLLGVAMVGMSVPARLRDRLMARFYYEKLNSQEVRA